MVSSSPTNYTPVTPGSFGFGQLGQLGNVLGSLGQIGLGAFQMGQEKKMFNKQYKLARDQFQFQQGQSVKQWNWTKQQELYNRKFARQERRLQNRWLNRNRADNMNRMTFAMRDAGKAGIHPLAALGAMGGGGGGYNPGSFVGQVAPSAGGGGGGMGGGGSGAGMDAVGAGIGMLGDAVRGLYEDDVSAMERAGDERRWQAEQSAIGKQTNIANAREAFRDLIDREESKARINLYNAQAMSALADARRTAIGGNPRMGADYGGNTPLMPNVTGGGVYGEAAGSYGMLVGEAYGIADWFDDVASNIRKKLGVGSRVLGKPRTLQARPFSKGRGK